MPSAFGGIATICLSQTIKLQRQCLYSFLNAHYQGWVILPHWRLMVTKHAALDHSLSRTIWHYTRPRSRCRRTVKLTGPSHGLTNTREDSPSGAYDIRNTRIQLSPDNQMITVTASDGVNRIYHKHASCYLLAKEVLLNGHVIRLHI